ncbi:MAG TPA: M3 family metallopeptidase [Solirubrobacteraceae bacterium]|nr:M3 family metallopeptidase [Solirubrobacteraceae bacterium]
MATDTTAETRLDDELPRWDLDVLFPSLDSDEYRAARAEWRNEIEQLVALFDRHGIGAAGAGDGRAAGVATGAPSEEDGRVLADVITALGDLQERITRLDAFVSGLVSTDATDSAAAAEYSRLSADYARVTTLQTRLNGWIARFGADALAATSELAAEHSTWIRRCEQRFAHQMSDAEEDLLAELEVPGVEACVTLAGDLSSMLEAEVRGERLPISAVRGLAGDGDPALRREAYEAEQVAWETIAVPMAACLNVVAGHGLIVDRRRGWPDALAPNLWLNRVSPEIVEAMQTAARESFPDFRRFLRAKATLHGHEGALPWWDLIAPVPGAPAYDWSAAEAAVLEAFGRYTPRLRALAERAFQERWVDAGPRPGKRGGGFCMRIGDGASRILMNFDGSFDSAQTLAHELGHAYHNLCLAPRPPLLRPTPMALAETASIFCETIMVQSGLEAADDRGRLALLGADLAGATQVVVDIHSRFLFESELYRRRADGPLSVDELCEAMRTAQAETYGDGVDPATYHPWMWAVKPHYYDVHLHFYNWPYCFGLLFGIGLYARYLADPDAFRRDYDDLLSRTGVLDAQPLAERFGIDLRDTGFWRSSLDVIRERIDTFCTLAAGAAGRG